MTIILRQSTASQEIPLGYFLDKTDGDTAETGLSIANTDIKIWKSGATTLADKTSGGATHMADGVYYAVLDATDTNTIGPLVIFCHVSGALATKIECVVLDEAVYDVLFGTTAPSTYAGGDTSGVTTLLSRVVGTLASGTHNAQSGDSYARLGAPAGASVSADVAAVKAQTAAIETDTQDLQTQVGTDGAGLTALPWNAAWDAEVQSEAADAITAAALATAANLATLAGYVDTEVAAILAAVDTEVAAIKTKTDYLPSATAGAAGGLFIAGTNAATSITTALTANITGNLSGSVGSVTGAVGSVTGNVGGSVASVAANGITATSIATDAINAAAVKADAVTKIQTGLATPTNITAGTITTVTNLTNLPAAAALEATLTAMKGATFSGATDSLEAIRDRGDAAWIAADVSDLPTNSELATALASADDAVLAAIAALPTDADVQTAATAALNAYDPPTNAEMVARTLVAASYFDPAADTVANVTTVATTTNLTNLPAAAALEATAQAILEDTGTTLPGTLATIAGYIDTEVAAILAAVDTEVAAILADTNELQTNQGNWVTADVSALATSAELAKVPKSDGSASWNATALAAINAQADTALADYDAPTKTEMDAAFTAIKGATWNSGTDTLEALRDRGDAAWTTADVSDLPTNSELATALASADDAVLAAVADVPTVAEFEARTLLAADYTVVGDLPSVPSAADIKTELEADGSKLDHLWEMTEDDGGVRRLTANALEEAPAGGSGTADWTTDEREQIRYRLQLDGTQTAPADTDLPAVNVTLWKGADAGDAPLKPTVANSTLAVDANGYAAADLKLWRGFAPNGLSSSGDVLTLVTEIDNPAMQNVADALLLAPSGAAASGSAMDVLADILEDTGTTLPAAIADLPTASEIDTELSGTHGDGSWEGEAAAGGGTGYYTDTVTDGASPLDGVQVQLYTAQDRVGLAYEAYTNALGVFEMWPDPGTYYRWLDLAGYSFTQDVEVEVTEP